MLAQHQNGEDYYVKKLSIIICALTLAACERDIVVTTDSGEEHHITCAKQSPLKPIDICELHNTNGVKRLVCACVDEATSAALAKLDDGKTGKYTLRLSDDGTPVLH
jgi:hypothetical protein